MTAISKSCICVPQRWVTVMMGFLGLFNEYAMRICLSIAITEMAVPTNYSIEFADDTCANQAVSNSNNSNPIIINKGTFQWSEYTQGIILSSFYWGYIFTNFLGGALAQKFGGRHTLGISILSTAFFTLLTPVCVNWGNSTALIVLRILMGFGEGPTYPALSALMAKWVPVGERSKACAIVYSGAPLGTIFGMTASGYILQRSEIGWPAVFYFFGSIGVLGFLLNTAFCYSQPSDNPFMSEAEATYLKKELTTTDEKLPPTPWRYILRSAPVWANVIAVIGNAWGFLTIVSDMPKFMSSVLRLSVEDNGYISSVSYLSMWISSFLMSCLADWLIAIKGISIVRVRKIFSTISSVGPGIFLVLASYTGCDGFVVVVLITISLALLGSSTSSVLVNSMDVGPNYAGPIMGVVNGISTLSGIISPYVVGVITPNQTISEWRIVFWIVFIFFIVTNTVFLIYGSGQIQEWNDPAFLEKEKELKKDEVEGGIELLPLNKQ